MFQKAHILRSLVEQRLSAAAEEIFGLFERTIAEYEEELCRTKEENHRQRQILESGWNPRVQLHETDIQQVSVVKDEVPLEQQEWNPIVDHEEPEPEPPYIKEEQEELWTSHEVNITKFPSTSIPVKSEDDDEERVQSSQFYQVQTDETVVASSKLDCVRSEPSSSFRKRRRSQRKTNEQNEDQTLNHKPESKLLTNSLTEQMETEIDGDNGGGSEPDIILVHMDNVKRRTFNSKVLQEEHMDAHTGQKLVGSSEYEATFSQRKNTTQETNSPRDMMMNNDPTPNEVGSETKVYHCFVCSKTFSWKSSLKIHMMSHTGEKPFTCPLCHKCFGYRKNFKRHMSLHTGEKPFSCAICQKSFQRKEHVEIHMKVHMKE